MLKKEVERYVPVSKLKYYFAVDTKYVISKLMLLFFPFTHKVCIFFFNLFSFEIINSNIIYNYLFVYIHIFSLTN